MILKQADYTFDKNMQTITFNGIYGSLEFQQIQLITNVVDNIIIYQFNKSLTGGSYAAPVLTLTYDTTGMDDTDELMIVVDPVTLGRQDNDNSMPVVLSSDQSDILTGTNQILNETRKYEDSVSANGDSGIPAMAIRTATPADKSGTEGDYEMLQMKSGRLWTSSTIDAALPAGSALIGGVNIVDSAGTNKAAIDSNGALAIQSGGSTGSAVPTRAIQMAGSDGTNLRAIKVSSAGIQVNSIDQTTDGTTNKVRATGTIKPSYGTTTVLAVTALQNLSNSATVGWKSVRTSNLSTLATDYEVMVSLTTANTAPANDKAMYVYVIPWYTSDGGTTWFAASGGTTTLPTSSDASYTIASPNNFKLLGVLNYTTQQMVCQDVFLLSNAFGSRMPDGFSIFIANFSGAALSTGCIVDITPINEVIV